MTDELAKLKHSRYKNSCQKRKLRALTFDEYCAKLQEAGITAEQIGTRMEDYHLCRYTDEGDYTMESCRFATRAENIQDFIRNKVPARGGRTKAGRTKHNHAGVMMQVKTKERPFTAISPCGKLVIGRNLLQFCADNGLNQGAMWNVLNGKRGSHRGWRMPSHRLLALVIYDRRRGDPRQLSIINEESTA